MKVCRLQKRHLSHVIKIRSGQSYVKSGETFLYESIREIGFLGSVSRKATYPGAGFCLLPQDPLCRSIDANLR